MLQLTPFLWWTLSAIRLSGDATCPSPTIVQAQLDSLVAPSGSEHLATLTAVPEGVELHLLGAEGSVIARRTLPSNSSCDSLAQAAAVVLATWAVEYASEAAEPSPLSVESPVEVKTAGTVSAPDRRWVFEVGGALLGSLSAGGPVGGGMIRGSVGSSNSHLSAELSVLYDGVRQISIGPGYANWQRWDAVGGVTYSLSRLPFRVEISGDAVLSLVSAQGIGFTPDSSAIAVDPGLSAGARILLLNGSWHPWIGAWVTGWLRSEVPTIQGLSAQPALPQIEGFGGLGLCWRSIERF